jgi:AcrR family transcriptional regulator
VARSISDNQILEAALDMIVQRGYSGATTREIAAAAGINEVTLFRRFGSKEKLLHAAIEQEAEHFGAAEIDYTGDLEADLARIFRFYLELVKQRGRAIFVLINELPRRPELLEILQVPMGIAQKVANILMRYQAEGRLIQEPPIHALSVLVGPLLLRGMLDVVGPETFQVTIDPEEQVQRYLQGRAVR